MGAAAAAAALAAAAAAAARLFRRPGRVQRTDGPLATEATPRVVPYPHRRLRVLQSGLEGGDPPPPGSALSWGCPLPTRAWGSLPFYLARACCIWPPMR